MYLDTIVHFIERREPGFLEQIQGSDEAELEALSVYCGRQPYGMDVELDSYDIGRLPAAYVEFMRTMGHKSAGFNPMPEADFATPELIKYIELNMPIYRSSRYLVIGVDRSQRDISIDWFLELVPGEADPPVVGFESEGQWDKRNADRLCSSFTELLKSRAFSQYALERRAQQAERFLFAADPHEPEHLARDIVALLQKLGFVPTELGITAGWWAGERIDASVALSAVTCAERTLYLCLGADDTKTLRSILAVLDEHLPSNY